MANKETTMSTTHIDDVKLGCDLIGDINSYIREHGLKHNDTTLWNDIIKSAPVEAHQQMAQIAYELYSSGYKSPKMSDSQQFTRVMDFLKICTDAMQYEIKVLHPSQKSNQHKQKMWRIVTQLNEIVEEYNQPKQTLFTEAHNG